MVKSRGAAAAVATAVCILLFTACGSPATPQPPPASPPAVPPSSAESKPDVAKSAALAAYRGMWADFVAAGVTSDWQSARLGDHATGLALTNLSRGLYADRRNGLVTRGQPVLDPAVSSVEPTGDPTKAVVTDCGDSSSWLKHRETDGSLADDTPGGRQLINAIVEKQTDGSWKVSDFGVQAVGSC